MTVAYLIVTEYNLTACVCFRQLIVFFKMLLFLLCVDMCVCMFERACARVCSQRAAL